MNEAVFPEDDFSDPEPYVIAGKRSPIMGHHRYQTTVFAPRTRAQYEADQERES